ncbi:uncharacterized protein LOC111695373 isoform X2 [Eurytemora carolleeae]|uniref:uncharacterized protein LOC111695373 isoform X2 n=1 Tax=Eurytemora carolleeae TaxID=1294199 RepID=UPI000C76FC11|nr:uncharacterized protein LOC111695373 isoform X2 [Eurytemora carolleeae]|eukprot:XP_023320457.1 uncharacterized protein LOC111695373 isoform X2 [Eurytemora affinis]
MVWFGGCVTEIPNHKTMKPNESISEDQFIISSGQIKSQVDTSSGSDTLQLILQSDHNLDSKSIMFDLSKLLQDNPNLGLSNGQQRVLANSPPSYSQHQGSLAPHQVGGMAPQTSIAPRGGVGPQGMHNSGMQGIPQGINIPKRTMFNIGQSDLDETFSVNTASSSFGAFGQGSYETSPRPVSSPVLWDSGHIQIKEEDEAGIILDGHSTHIRHGSQSFYPNSELTLAQLNSPPNEDITMTTLKNLEELDSINLDLDILTSDILFPSHTFTDIKIESDSIGNSMFQWGRESQLSSSVPVSVISSLPDYQGGYHYVHSHNGYRPKELSNLSNGGPAISPSRLTLSPSNLAMSPSRTGLSPPGRSNLSPLSQPLSPLIPDSLVAGSRNSTLHELLMRQDQSVPDPIRPRSNSNQFKSAKRPIGTRQRNSLSISNPLLASQLSKSAPVKTLPIEKMIWSRRDPRPHMNSVCSNAGDSSIADEVSEIMNSLSPGELNDIDSEDEFNETEELESDEDLRIDEDGEGGSSKKDRHFWQYNVQAKGPKGQKLALDTKITDPHQLNEIIDPVFSDSVQVHGIKHSGKARRGDGNDLTANPKKLAAIGKELDKLNKEINLMTPVSEVPFSTRTKTRKEKNKLASRACRLKKKAQHEANKLKLHGLEEEHNELMRSIHGVKEILQAKWAGAQGGAGHQQLSEEAEKILKKAGKNRVAGQTTEYVNRMITKYS